MGFLNYITGRRGPSGFGSSSTAEEVAQGISLNSYVAIVTGATSGIGYETARVLAKQGAHVVIPARKIKDAERVRSDIKSQFPNAIITVGELDLSSLASVRKFAIEFRALNLPLHILVNNAGLGSTKFALSPDGLELDFATNHMGHFLLVELLLDIMIKTASETGIEGRIVILSSVAHTWVKDGIDFDKLNDKASFTWAKGYGRSKLANLLHANELARHLQEKNANVTVNSLHPGSIYTKFTREYNKLMMDVVALLGRPFLKTIPQGAATTVYAAVHPSMKGVSGKYLVDCNIEDCAPLAKDEKLTKQLWEFSENFVKAHP